MESTKSATPGDAAIDGLIHGLIAGALMLVYLVVIGWIQARPVTVVLGLFSPETGANPFYGAVAHLAVSSIYGAGFAMAFRKLRGNWWALAAGLGYGLLLIAIANFLLIPGYATALAAIEPLQMSIAHIVYGLVMGAMTKRGAGE
ncbi:MAG TPA: hypothetical protein VMN57_09620 [Anaerolineales bacterium]|nr:hypothetical protein [Anaerolineales bacterium]